jgi:hypothetical protein
LLSAASAASERHHSAAAAASSSSSSHRHMLPIETFSEVLTTTLQVSAAGSLVTGIPMCGA